MVGDIDVNVTPVRNPTFVTLSDGSIRNTYDIRLRNKHHEDRMFRFSVDAPGLVRIELEGTPEVRVSVDADATLQQRVYLIAPPGSELADAARTDLTLWIEVVGSSSRVQADTVFNGKEQ